MTRAVTPQIVPNHGMKQDRNDPPCWYASENLADARHRRVESTDFLRHDMENEKHFFTYLATPRSYQRVRCFYHRQFLRQPKAKPSLFVRIRRTVAVLMILCALYGAYIRGKAFGTSGTTHIPVLARVVVRRLQCARIATAAPCFLAARAGSLRTWLI